MFSKFKFKHKILFGFIVPIAILMATSIYMAINMYHIAQVQQWLTDISATRAAPGFNDGWKKAEEYSKDIHLQLDVFLKHYKSQNDSAKVKLVA